MLQVVVFHHAGMELAGQADDRQHRQQQRGDEALRKQGRLEHGADRRHVTDPLPHVHRAVEDREQAEQADDHERHQLDEGFKTHRQHQPGLVLGGVDMAGAEQQRKDRHQSGHHQGDVRRRRHLGAHHMLEGQGHRLELQGDVGQHADHRHQGHQHRQLPGLAVAGGHEVGDRGDVVLLAHRHQLINQLAAQQHGEDRAEINGQVGPAVAAGLAHGAVKGPGGAVHAQAQAVGPGVIDHPQAAPLGAVPPPGDHEQHHHIQQGEHTQLPETKQESASVRSSRLYH